MNRQEHLFSILAEECCEVGQRCSKTLRFGGDDVQAGQSLSNKERLAGEFEDLIAVYEMLQAEDLALPLNRENINRKKEKVERYFEYSRGKGTLGD